MIWKNVGQKKKRRRRVIIWKTVKKTPIVHVNVTKFQLRIPSEAPTTAFPVVNTAVTGYNRASG